MTDKDIERLAREFTDELFAGDDLTDHQTIEEKNDCYVTCMAFCGYLLEKHCIVPKELVLSQHAWYMQRMKEVSSARQTNRAKAIALEAAFGTELFGERREE